MKTEPHAPDLGSMVPMNSLLILDEIGRGTSTFDGMSIARAVLEYCADPKRLGAKTLFATHYHELTAMEGTLPGVKNYNIAVRARGEEIIFLRKIVPGGADRSYGIEVAKLAGLPPKVLSRARTVLQELESGQTAAPAPAAPAAQAGGQMSMESLAEAEVLDKLRHTQPDTLTPIEAMTLLYELKQKLQQEGLFDPQTSGGLLMAVDAVDAEKMQRKLLEQGIPAAIVGKITEPAGTEIYVTQSRKW